MVVRKTSFWLSSAMSRDFPVIEAFTTAVYDLELVSAGSQVTQFCGGVITLYKEVTR